MSEEEEEIWFYKRDRAVYEPFSNFALLGIEMNGRSYITVEHWYQSMKAQTEADHELVRMQPSPYKAMKMGRQIAIRPDFLSIKYEVMKAGVRRKFETHEDARNLLLSTQNMKLSEDAERDSIWGTGPDGLGTDYMGAILMEIRDEIRQAQKPV